MKAALAMMVLANVPSVIATDHELHGVIELPAIPPSTRTVPAGIFEPGVCVIPETYSCHDLTELEPHAALGRLHPDRLACLEDALDDVRATDPREARAILRLLAMDAFAAGEPSRHRVLRLHLARTPR